MGKTQVAHELRRRLGRGWVADPELVGYGLHRMLPRRLRQDLQDEPAWRLGIRDALRRTDTPVVALSLRAEAPCSPPWSACWGRQGCTRSCPRRPLPQDALATTSSAR